MPYNIPEYNLYLHEYKNEQPISTHAEVGVGAISVIQASSVPQRLTEVAVLTLNTSSGLQCEENPEAGRSLGCYQLKQ